MRTLLLVLVALSTPPAWAAAPYEGSWFTCVFAMAGRVNPWSVETIRTEEGELRVFSEWGSKYSFSGTARVEGKELVVRGCSYYVDKPMESCDPAKPPIAEKMKLPLRRAAPSNLDMALRRGDSIFLAKPGQFERFAGRCEKLIEADDLRKATR